MVGKAGYFRETKKNLNGFVKLDKNILKPSNFEISSDRSNRSSSSSSSVELESSMRFGGSIEPLKSSMVRSIEPKANQMPT